MTLFGKDVSKIPCFRESFLNGILGGAVIGIGTFLKTSQPRRSCNNAMGSYVLITLFYWSYCRYEIYRLTRFASFFSAIHFVFVLIYFQLFVVQRKVPYSSNSRRNAEKCYVPGHRRRTRNQS